ncbi:MAG TPA: hypothetical protein VFT95_15560 [Micromonosporaceae bacterium]|nr:hypothetical protein [Micromonosporaceae bacterium]
MPLIDPNGLPFVDEHRVRVDASAAAVWRALTERVRQFSDNGALARVLGAEPRAATVAPAADTPLAAGAALTGFAVAEVVPERLLRLAGRHRFSRYALVFDVDIGPDATVLSARTYAAFPGLRGKVYRALVIGSGAHRLVTVRLLRSVRRDAERL